MLTALSSFIQHSAEQVYQTSGCFCKCALQVQNATLERFKNGQLNCLVSTSVAEEGLDLKACQLVARHHSAGS